VEIGIVAVQFLFLEYLFRIFGIVSLQCIEMMDLKMDDAGTFQLEPDLGQVARPVRDKLTRTQQFKSNIFKVNPSFITLTKFSYQETVAGNLNGLKKWP
jgi:hypothetical protein